jgi:GDP-L-fucose synthase
MNKESKILVTGATGMVGSELVKSLKARGYGNLLTPSRSELDLRNFEQVDRYFSKHQPSYVFMIAAKVGGIAANMADPVGFLEENLEIELNLFKACHKHKTKKNLFLGSSCIYPKDSPQPMKEEYLMTGPLEPTNEGYAFSKIVGLRLAQYYFEQYKMSTICLMSSNIYGTNDTFELSRSHVMSALVRKFVDAKDQGLSEVTLWGTGIAKREFIHVEDVVQAILFFMLSDYNKPNIINVGTGYDISIRELAELIRSKVGYQGELKWDTTKLDGMLRKCMDVSKMTQLGFTPSISLDQGITRTIEEYNALKKTL